MFRALLQCPAQISIAPSSSREELQNDVGQTALSRVSSTATQKYFPCQIAYYALHGILKALLTQIRREQLGIDRLQFVVVVT